MTLLDLQDKEAEKLLPVSACLSPFSNRIATGTARPGQTLASVFEEKQYWPIFFNGNETHVFVNDELILRDDWSMWVLNEGDIVSVRVFPRGTGGGEGGKSPGRTAAMVGITILAIVATALSYGTLAPEIGPMWAGIVAGMAGAAVSTGGMLALNALIPLHTIKPFTTERTNDISGTQNVFEPYGAVTRIFGTSRIFPKYAAIPYTELVGQAIYLRCLFLIGKGKYVLNNHKIGDTDLNNYSGVEVETYYSGSGLNSFALFPNTVTENQMTTQLTYNNWVTYSTAINTDEISIEFAFFSGLYFTKSDGHYNSTSVGIAIEYTVYGQTNWVTYTGTWTVHFSVKGSSNIAVGQSWTGPTGNGTVTYVHKTYTTIDTGVNDEFGNDIMSTTSVTDYVRLTIASGTISAGQTLTFGGSYTAVVDSAGAIASAVTIAEESRSAYRYGVNIKVPRGQYTVRMMRTTEDNRPDHTDDSHLTAFRSIKYEAPVNLANCTLIGLRIKASNQLNGIISSYNCVATSILPAYNGSTWDESANANPAWAMCEVLRGSSNERPLPDSRLNLPAIRTFAANCDAAGRTYNEVIDRQMTVWELLKRILSVGRATPGVIDNKWTVIEDVAQSTPVQHFSPRNSWGFQGKRLFPDFPHAFKVKFKNAAAEYQEDQVYVYDDGYNSGNASVFEDLSLPGITDYDSVWKLARYHLACIRLRPEVWEFNADVENIVCTRGSLIRVTHDVISIGLGAGRVRSMTTSGGNILTLTFDDVFTHVVGHSYGFQFRKSTGVFGTATCQTNAGDNYTITITGTLSVANGPAVGDLCFFGEAGVESTSAIVTRITPGPKLTAKIACVNYNSAIYTADSGQIPAWGSAITQDPIGLRVPPTPKIESYVYDYKSANRNDDGTYKITMTVAFSVQQTGFVQNGVQIGSSGPDVVQGFECQYQVDDMGWISLPNLGPNSRSFEFFVQNGSTYDFRVRAFSNIQNYSGWATQSDVTIALSGSTPANVTGLQVKGGGTTFTLQDLEIEWTAVTGGGTAGLLVQDYQVLVYTSDGLTLLRTEYVTGTFYSYTWLKNIQDGGPRASLHFHVKARSFWGDLSVTEATLTATNAAPSAPTGLGKNAIQGGVEFYWTANTEKDLKYYQYRIKVDGGSGGTFGSWQQTSAVGVVRMLTNAEKTSYGGGATIYIEVKATDIFNQDSSSSATNQVCGSLNIASTDIANFAVTASKIFTKIPVIEGLTLTPNSPASGRIAWSACTVYYNGTAYSISSGNTPNASNKYVYWKDLASTFTAADNHPAPDTPNLTTWNPEEDFIIAINIGGIAQAAWNGIANQVIGSAYIMNAAINDAQVNTLSGSKISASSSVAIGSQTFGNDGIQLEYNSNNPRFYAGDGANNYVKFDGSTLEVKGKLIVQANSSGYANFTDKPTITNIFYQSSAPSAGMVAGDLWIDSDDNKMYRYTTSWGEIQDDQIALAIANAATAQAIADGKIKTISQASMPIPSAASGTLITNGTMEVDANWSSVGTPTSNVRSNTQKYSGAYSRYFAVDAALEGIKGAVFTTTTNEVYSWLAWVYPSWTSVRVVIRNGANSADSVATEFIGLTAGAWNLIGGQFTEAAGGANASISFLSPTGQASGSCYVDDVTLVNGTTAAANIGVGDIWFDIDDNNKPWRWNSGMWIEMPYDVATWSKITGTGKPQDYADTTGYMGLIRDAFDDSARSLELWEKLYGTGEVSIIADSSALAGGKVMQVGNNSGNDEARLVHKQLIPFDPNKLYRIKIRVKRTAGTGTIYVGMAGRNTDNTLFVFTSGSTSAGIDGNNHYFAAFGDAPSSSWTEYTGYFKGSAATGSGKSADPQTPGAMQTSCKYMRLMIAAGYSGQTGTFLVDEIALDVLPEFTLATRNSIGTGQVDSTIISGGKIVTGLLTASNIQTGTLDASAVTVTNLNASNLTAGSIDAGRIAAETITYDKLVSSVDGRNSIAGMASGTSSVTVTRTGSDYVFCYAWVYMQGGDNSGTASISIRKGTNVLATTQITIQANDGVMVFCCYVDQTSQTSSQGYNASVSAPSGGSVGTQQILVMQVRN